MEKFASLRVPDQLMIVFAVTVVIATIVCMVIYSSESIKKFIRRRLIKLVERIEAFNDKFFTDDEPFDPEWMKANEWSETRIR